MIIEDAGFSSGVADDMAGYFWGSAICLETRCDGGEVVG